MRLGNLASWREKKYFMADISSNFLGIKSPNPFWLASAPPTDKKINVLRAFEAGWGGVVWKTLGSQVKNVSSRYSAVDFNGTRIMGLPVNYHILLLCPLYLFITQAYYQDWKKRILKHLKKGQSKAQKWYFLNLWMRPH